MILAINLLIAISIAAGSLAAVGLLIWALDKAASPRGKRPDRRPTLYAWTLIIFIAATGVFAIHGLFEGQERIIAALNGSLPV